MSQPTKPSGVNSDSYSELTSKTQTVKEGQREFLPSADESQPTHVFNDDKGDFLPSADAGEGSHYTQKTSSNQLVPQNKSANNISSKRDSYP